MSREAEHSRIIAAAALNALKPLGFWRKGRSRVWLADRGFWLSVVEFQPSGFSKGSYLNVAAHWLWSAMPEVLSLDYMLERHKPRIRFTDATEFGNLAERLAEQAADESRQLERKIGTIRALAIQVTTEEAEFARQGRPGGWPAFYAAVANGISGDMALARTLFQSAYETVGSGRPDLQTLLLPYIDALADRSTFGQFIEQKVHEQRAEYGLSPTMLANHR